MKLEGNAFERGDKIPGFFPQVLTLLLWENGVGAVSAEKLIPEREVRRKLGTARRRRR